MGHDDIRIGTLVGINDAPRIIPQILPHGFESFQLTGGFGVVEVDFNLVARQVADAIGDQAVISSIGYFGNPLMKPEDAELFGRYIDHAETFGAKVVIGFTGSIDGTPLPEQWQKFKEVWSPLVKRARDRGVRIGFENCDMGGRWDATRFNLAHAPTAWDMMFNELGTDVLGLCWEPCHQMVSLIDPLPQLRKYLPHIWHVHGKDATIAWDVLRTTGLRGGKPFVWHRTPGFGDTNWTDVISILRMGGWRGSIDIEGFHDPVYRKELEYTGQVHALNYLRQCRGGTFVPNPS
ncbi:MAG TPA: sugar phosphate isomerase/epimerase [Tepidisphaeraceae bacterium]|nr:sugar phosphate isomerase/epimerase [Tepidisphaeraceae bacterium]